MVFYDFYYYYNMWHAAPKKLTKCSKKLNIAKYITT